jgi:hypothetical protein
MENLKNRLSSFSSLEHEDWTCNSKDNYTSDSTLPGDLIGVEYESDVLG